MNEAQKIIDKLTKENDRLTQENDLLRKKLDAFELMHSNCENRLKRSTQAENALNNIIDSNPLSTLITYNNGKTKSVNLAFLNLFKFKPAKDYCVFNDCQLIEQGMKPYFERLQQGDVVYFPEHSYNLSKINPELPDTILWLRVIAFPIFLKNGKPERYVIIHQNITREKLDKEKIELQYQQLQDVNEYIVEVRELERKKLSITIHDDILQYITSLKFRISMIKAIHDDEERITFIKNLMADTDKVIENLKINALELFPEPKGELDLYNAINNFANEFASANNLIISCDITPDSDMNQTVASLIFSILKQALFNIAQHSEADNAEIKLKQNKTCFEFSITDNGKGIQQKDIAAQSSIGIRGMKDRVEAMGGSFLIKAGNKNGTILQVKLPKLK